MNLQNARVIGFFSLPMPSLAESNPAAYARAMADAPPGAGACGHCGIGIRHHVIVRLADGTQDFIGTTCAERVGDDRMRRCVRDGVSDEILAKREAAQVNLREQQQAQEAAWAKSRAHREEMFADELATLANQGTGFHDSLARQLINGPVTPRQADFICKAFYGPRRNKSNAAGWDSHHARYMGRDADWI